MCAQFATAKPSSDDVKIKDDYLTRAIDYTIDYDFRILASSIHAGALGIVFIQRNPERKSYRNYVANLYMPTFTKEQIVEEDGIASPIEYKTLEVLLSKDCWSPQILAFPTSPLTYD